MFESLLNAFRAPDIRRRILFVLAILVVYRLMAQIPLPGVDRDALRSFFERNSAFGIIDLFAGGGLSQLSIVGLAMNPYINASIIMQLMTGVIPSLQALSREGEYGRNKINQYTRYLSVPMAMLQAYGILTSLIVFAIIGITAVAVIIYIQEGQRRIPVQSASRVRGRRMYQGGQTFLPLRVNQAGVIPIIFAISILLFPQQIASYFTGSEVGFVR